MLPRLPLLIVLLLSPLTLAAPIDLAEGREPQIAATPADHHVHVAYGRDNAIHVATSADDGQTFPADTTLPDVPRALSLGMRRGPRIAAGDGFLLVTAIAGAKGRGQDGDLLAWRSTDSGVHWTGPTKVNDIPAAAREGLHALASDGGHRVYAAWLDLRTGHTRLAGALSRDGGLTWEANETIYESPDGHICECCHPSVAFLPDGRVAVMFRNYLAGDRDMYLATFTPGNAAGGTVQVAKLGADSWKLNACPMDGGSLAVDPEQGGQGGGVLTAWQRAGKVYLTGGQGGEPGGGNGGAREGRETLLGDGVQPSMTLLNHRPAVVWTSARTGKLLFLPPASPSPTPLQLADHATDPVLLNSGGRLLCAWTANNHVFLDVISDAKSK